MTRMIADAPNGASIGGATSRNMSGAEMRIEWPKRPSKRLTLSQIEQAKLAFVDAARLGGELLDAVEGHLLGRDQRALRLHRSD